MKTKNLFKKIIALVLVVTMLIPTISHLGTNVKEVRAEDATTEITDESIGYVIVPSESVNNEGSQPTVKVGYESNKYSDYLFAGWYTDAEALIASASGGTGAYARFVPADVLSVKVQVTNGLVTDTSINEYRNKYVMRFVSSIDSLDYKNAGFEITYKEGESTITRTNTTTTGFKRIDSSTGSTEKGMDLYEYSPKVISTKSEYFVTAKWPLVDTSQKITVKAFWTTKDGTRVYGGSRCVAVEDGVAVDANFEDVQKTNVSFKSSTEYSEDDIINAITYGTNGAKTTATVIGCSTNVDGTYTVHTRVDVVPSLLPSVTQFTFGENETAIYRNLLTKYAGTTNTADDTWYETYKNVTNEFVIATSADFYGLASLVNASEDNVTFADKTIYLVSDIKVNKGTAKDTGWVAATGETTYLWTPIGTSSKPFSGTFDGQMHSISGIHLTATGNSAGMFGTLQNPSDGTACIQNLILNNSYFYSTYNNLGSIAGYVNGGKLDSIKTSAIVIGTKARTGGVVGMTESTFNVSNCWFAGNVSNTSTNQTITGGIVGDVYSGTAYVTNCLNTGLVDVSSYTTVSNNVSYPCAGGLVGRANANVTIQYCLNAEQVQINPDIADVTYGGIIGQIQSGKTVTIDGTYTDGNKCAAVCGYNNGSTAFTVNGTVIGTYSKSKNLSIEGVSIAENVTGEAAKTTFAGFDFKKTWTVVTNGTPILTSFEDEIINPDTSWYIPEGGTAENPFVLYDKNDLYGFANLVNAGNNFAGKIIRLGDDIVINKGDAEDYAECVPQFEWTPIGTTAATAFAGTFDGSDPETGEIHTISGIYLNTSSQYAGLFGVVQTTTDYPTATVKNLELKNSYIFSSTNSLGSVVGYVNGGTIDTVYSNATVKSSGGGYQGGIAGVGKSVTINNSWFAGNVINTNTSGQRLGGFVGEFSSGKFTMNDCLNTGIVTAAYNGTKYPLVAGFVGNIVANLTATMTDCLNTGRVTTSASIPGVALAGCVNSGATLNIYTSYSDADKCTTVIGYAGGIVKSYDEKNTAHSVASKATTETTMNMSKATTETGVIAGFDFEHVWEVTDATPILKSFAGGVIAPDTTWYDGSSTYILYNAADLYGFSKLSQNTNFEGKTVQLGADIVVNEGDAEDWAESAPYYSWMPIGQKTAFKGTFDGSDPEDADVIHSISGLYFETSTRNSGLFGQIAGTNATIQNLKLTNSYFGTSNVNNVGGIVGYANGGNIDTVYNDAIVVASKERVGGVIGIGASTVTITNTWFAGKVTNASNMTGGFVGDQNSGSLSMTNCLNTGLVDVSGYATDIYPRAGGLVGNLTKGTVTLDNCLNTGIKCVYDAATTVYGAFTGYLGSSTSLTITQTYADVDKWGSVGYYSVKDKKDDGTPVETYNTVNGKYGNDYVDEVKADLVALLLEHSAVIGDAAKDSLEGFDFDSTWTVLSDGTVVLAKFADMKVADTEKTALHSKLVSSQSLVANNAEKIVTLPEPDTNSTDSVYYQGGCTPDGQYFYQAAITKKDTTEGALEVNNEVKIVRYNLSTGEAVWSDAMGLNHANDITYNSDLDCFVVCHNTGNPTRVSYLKINDAGKLEAVDENNDGAIDGADLTYSGYSIDYNATYDRYVVGRSEAEYFDVYDADFNRLYSFEAKDEYKGIIESGTYTRNVPQGISCDNNYIYHLINKKDFIVVYDWYGTFVTKIDLSSVVKHEPENVSVVGDAIYVTDVYHLSIGNDIKYDTATIYRINASNIGQ